MKCLDSSGNQSKPAEEVCAENGDATQTPAITHRNSREKDKIWLPISSNSFTMDCNPPLTRESKIETALPKDLCLCRRRLHFNRNISDSSHSFCFLWYVFFVREQLLRRKPTGRKPKAEPTRSFFSRRVHFLTHSTHFISSFWSTRLARGPAADTSFLNPTLPSSFIRNLHQGHNVKKWVARVRATICSIIVLHLFRDGRSHSKETLN